MLQIREDQFHLFKRLPRTNFERALYLYLQKNFPRETKALGEQAALKLCDRIINDAENLGFHDRREVFYYLSMVFLLGSGFSNDPSYPWVQATLSNTNLLPLKKTESLWEQTRCYISEIAGDDNQHFITAMIKLKRLQTHQIPDLNTPDYSHVIHTLLRELYKEKANIIGQSRIESIITLAKTKAKHYQINNSLGIGLLTSLLFFLGHQADNDPLYPWLSELLNTTHNKTLDNKTHALYQATLTYAKSAMCDKKPEERNKKEELSL